MKTCHDCSNCMYIGEGDYWCDKEHEIVMEDFSVNDNYLCCMNTKKPRLKKKE